MSRHPDPDAVGGSSRALAVLEALAEAEGPLTLTAISERVGAPLSSCHAVVRTLQARGYLYARDRRRGFCATRKLLHVAREIAAHDPIVTRVAPAMAELSARTGETVIVGRRQGTEAIYLSVEEGTHTIRYASEPGARKPLHASAIGKALLGGMAEHEAAAILATARPSRITERTLVAITDILADVADGRRRGYFETRGENVADVGALSMLAIIAGEAIAIALAGPLDRVAENRDTYVAALREVVARFRSAEVPD